MKRHLIVILINISLMIGDAVTFHITVGHLCLFLKNVHSGPLSCIRDNMGETGGHYAKWNKPDTQRQILCEITYKWNLTKSQQQRIEWYLPKAWVKEMRKCWSKAINFQLQDSGDLMYRMVTIVNRAVLYTRYLKFAERVNLKYSHHIQHKKMVTRWGDECINDLDSSYHFILYGYRKSWCYIS